MTLGSARPGVTAEPSGRDVIQRVETLLWGKTVQGQYEMTITTPRWQRVLGLRVWMDRPRRSFVRIVSPAKDAGIGSLRIGAEMSNYLPNVERVVKIPPSMMLQPWMGSDFTNDDLVKESSVLDDYAHRVVARGPGGRRPAAPDPLGHAARCQARERNDNRAEGCDLRPSHRRRDLHPALPAEAMTIGRIESDERKAA